jgi:hypothetical protein
MYTFNAGPHKQQTITAQIVLQTFLHEYASMSSQIFHHTFFLQKLFSAISCISGFTYNRINQTVPNTHMIHI